MQHTVLAALKSKLMYLLEKHTCEELISSMTVEKGTYPIFWHSLSINRMKGQLGTTDKFNLLNYLNTSVLEIRSLLSRYGKKTPVPLHRCSMPN